MTDRTLDRLRELAEEKLAPIVETVRARIARASSPPPPEPRASVPPKSEPTADAARAVEADIARLVTQLRDAPTWQARSVAAIALAEFRGDEVVDALVRAVRDPSAEVAVAAVESLACQPDARAAADLREVLRDTAGFVGPFTRAAAVEAIAKCLGEAAVPLLLDTLHDGDAEVSMAAVIAVARVAPDASVPRLLALLDDRSGYYVPVVRLTTAKALERIGGFTPESARSRLATETNEGVRVVLERVSRD